MLTVAVGAAWRDVPDDEDLLAGGLRPPEDGVDPVQVAGGVVEVEQEKKVEAVAEVGVDGDDPEPGPGQGLVVPAVGHGVALLAAGDPVAVEGGDAGVQPGRVVLTRLRHGREHVHREGLVVADGGEHGDV